MCGITGYWQINAEFDPAIAGRMSERLTHRGPDDEGIWADRAEGITLAHRRLSILDVSQAGHQPMQSPCGRYVLSYNGEIYNHIELRAELESGGGFKWRGHSDTETLLAGLQYWGVEDTLQRLNGMFAFALWDRDTRRLYLARDRMGEKPLYYFHGNNLFLFGSELKSLRAHPECPTEINRDVLALFLRHGYITAPWSIYKNIYKLKPAHYLVVSDAGQTVSEPIEYWRLGDVIKNVKPNQERRSDEDYIDSLDVLLGDSVKQRMLADVPLGALLSGGIDSSLVVALMQAQSSQPVKTFSIGFKEAGFDEAVFARSVAKHLGTDHSELYISSSDALDIIPKIPEIWDEPFSDPSQVPTFIVSHLARKHVTVGLSGDGGDELFCGYLRYTQGYELWRKISRFPKPLRTLSSHMLNAASSMGIENCIEMLPRKFRVSNISDRLRKLARVIQEDSPGSLYRTLLSQCENPDKYVINAHEPITLLNTTKLLVDFNDFRERMMYLDTMTYLPDDILVKVDRASMAQGLEMRVPMLDHRLVEYAWQLPFDLKYRSRQGKWLLKQLLYRYVPEPLVNRPKMGFGVPIDHWLRGSLREWAENLLDRNKLVSQGYLNPSMVRQCWEEHIEGKQNHQYKLWNILMFQAWLEENCA